MKKRYWILLIALIFLCFFGLFAFLGNPLSCYLAEKGAREYLQARYPDMALEITGTGYDPFVRRDYHVKLQSVHSEDTSFTLYLDGWGNVVFDTYDGDPLQLLSNTWARIQEEVDQQVSALLAEEFPTCAFRVTALEDWAWEEAADHLTLDQPAAPAPCPYPLEVTVLAPFSQAPTEAEIRAVLAAVDQWLAEQGYDAVCYDAIWLPEQDWNTDNWTNAVTLWDVEM